MEICRSSAASFPARLLAGLPAPWRLRLRIGQVTIDCTSSSRVEPNGWNRLETWYVLIAALEDRLTPELVEKSALARTTRSVAEASTWMQVGGGLDDRFLLTTQGTVGDALRKIGAELVGEWGGDAAEVTGHGQGRSEDVRGVRTRARRTKASVSAVRGEAE